MGFEKFLSNKLNYPVDKYFAGIIGECPSKGARSPLLWNKAFDFYKFPCQMIPLDVSIDNLSYLVNELKNNKKFIGGAVAVPHKVNIAKLMGKFLTKEAKSIGAVNALFRDDNFNLVGTNTDGEASRSSLIKKFGDISGRKVLILGDGGVAKAVAAYIATGVKESGKVLIASRSNRISNEEKDLLGINEVMPYENIISLFSEIDIIINCTTVGSADQIEKSLLKIDQLKLLGSNTIIYDVIYNPSPTLLLRNAHKLGLRTLDGLDMNLEQAVLAFHYANKNFINDLNKERIMESMKLSS